MSIFKISWGNTPKKKGLNDPLKYPKLNENSRFDINNWLSLEQQDLLLNIMNYSDKYPTRVVGYEIIRGAFHGFYTRIKPRIVDGNWGRNYCGEFNQLLDEIASAIDWYHVRIDGANAVVKQDPDQYGEKNSTWHRWKTNNPSHHLKQASKKNWEAYHSYIGDLDKVGEWDDNLFKPEEWNGKKNKNK